MKLLRIKTSNFKNCEKDTVIDLVAKSKKHQKIKNMNCKRLQKTYTFIVLVLLLGKMHLVRQPH